MVPWWGPCCASTSQHKTDGCHNWCQARESERHISVPIYYKIKSFRSKQHSAICKISKYNEWNVPKIAQYLSKKPSMNVHSWPWDQYVWQNRHFVVFLGVSHSLPHHTLWNFYFCIYIEVDRWLRVHDLNAFSPFNKDRDMQPHRYLTRLSDLYLLVLYVLTKTLDEIYWGHHYMKCNFYCEDEKN